MSPHQFGMAIKGGYKVVVHNIQIVLDVHIDWMVFKVDVMILQHATSNSSGLPKEVQRYFCWDVEVNE